MNIAVFGVGGTGAFFGGLLARAGNDVTFIARGEHLRAIQRDGLTVKSVTAGDFTLPVTATDDPSSVGPVDVVLFCVKGYDNATAIPKLKPLVGSDTVVISVQNGIDNERQIAEAIGDEHVLGGLALVASAIESPGVVAHVAARGRLIFGEMAGGTSPRAEQLLDVFVRAGILAERSDDIRVGLWHKYVGICGFSGVTALTRLPIGPIMSYPETRDFMRATLDEVTQLGRASGVALPDDTTDGWLATNDDMGRNQPWASSSMHHDLKVGRRLEVEFLNGVASRMGRELGVPTPANDAIFAALKPYANGAPEIPVAP